MRKDRTTFIVPHLVTGGYKYDRLTSLQLSSRSTQSSGKEMDDPEVKWTPSNGLATKMDDFRELVNSKFCTNFGMLFQIVPTVV